MHLHVLTTTCLSPVLLNVSKSLVDGLNLLTDFQSQLHLLLTAPSLLDLVLQWQYLRVSVILRANRPFLVRRVNKCQTTTVTTLTAHRGIAHQAPFVNGVTASSWWWHSRALDAALWPLGGWTPDRAIQPSRQRSDSSGQRGQVSSRRSWGKLSEQKPHSSPCQWDH